MTRYGLWISIIVILVLFAIGLLMTGVIYLAAYGETKLGTANCETMESQGHNTKLIELDIMGFNILDCYVEAQEGKYVPYDRYWNNGADGR